MECFLELLSPYPTFALRNVDVMARALAAILTHLRTLRVDAKAGGGREYPNAPSVHRANVMSSLVCPLNCFYTVKK